MFWPVFYTLIFSTIFLVVRGNDRRTTIALLALGLVVQIFDTRAGWERIRKELMVEPAPEWASPLKDAFWLDAAEKYNKVRAIWPGQPTYWQTLADYAGTHSLATNAVYLARFGKAAVATAWRDAAISLRTGKYEPDSLYVIEDNLVTHAVVHLNPEVDLLANINGFNVLAPGWKKCVECRHVENEMKVIDFLVMLKVGKGVQFTQSGAGFAYLTRGWFGAESWGTWSDGSYAEIILPMPASAKGILIEANALVSPSHPKQGVEIRVNGVLAVTTSLTRQSGNRIEVPIPVAVQKELGPQEIIPLEFNFLDSARPRDIGINEDPRTLALGLKAITVY
jgi:hypothetical protein